MIGYTYATWQVRATAEASARYLCIDYDVPAQEAARSLAPTSGSLLPAEQYDAGWRPVKRRTGIYFTSVEHARHHLGAVPLALVPVGDKWLFARAPLKPGDPAPWLDEQSDAELAEHRERIMGRARHQASARKRPRSKAWWWA